MTDQRLRWVHRWMGVASGAGLTFIPRVHATITGDSVAVVAGCCWDATDWMPGTADLCGEPQPDQWAAACAALADLHRAWVGLHTEHAPTPGVRRRLDLLAEWERTITPAAFDLFPQSEREFLDQVRRQTAVRVGWCRDRLAEWATVPQPLGPCVCDLRPEHVLFRDGAVTGVIDYGAMKVDSPAVDLARLLGDGSGSRPPNYALGLNAYNGSRPPFAVPEGLVHTLGETGVVCAAANWQLRLAHRPPPENFPAVRRRLQGLVKAFQP